ncbi:TetR family transcriptional regulator [Murinocardiopsis flavida]|uniref:TetR family transcriptional regulator n=1 Tax=Murinocardiopsis flavida TaxID=645275 RepID=A0A2P8DQZ7_9ACTN|nr:TetR/AcrR family transcriptional regulator [Murinocardiopsis flavida]PSK99641.1 TetR family transcriptional regulator [Murinocardiopsis flavida]
MAEDTRGGLRADARRNRDRIVASARALFAEHGAKVPMEEIARCAGVGVGTLYRRFPDRESLLHAVSADAMRRMLATARAAAEEEPDGWHALVRYLRAYGELHNGALHASVDPEMHDRIRRGPDVTRDRRALLAVLTGIIERAHAEGALRRDVGLGDISSVFALHLHLPAGTGAEAARAAPRRLVELLIAGLRAPAAEPLPGPPMAAADLEPADPPAAAPRRGAPEGGGGPAGQTAVSSNL